MVCRWVILVQVLVVWGGLPATSAEARSGSWRLNLRQGLRQARSISRNKAIGRWRRAALAFKASCRSVGLRRRRPPAVLLYQGAFDPVHRGHLTNIRGALTGVEDAGHVFVVPTSDHPGKHPVAHEHRVAMMRSAIAGERLRAQTTVVDDRHLARLSLEGFDDLTAMIHTRFPGSRVYIMTGSDAYLKAHASGLVDKALRWGYRYAVTPRAGYPLPATLPAGVEVMPLAGGEVSSSAIRRDLGAQRLPVGALGAPAARYIEQHGLYGYANGR